MPWVVLFHADFEPEFDELPEIVQDELLTRLGVLQEFAPPWVVRMWIRCKDQAFRI